MTDVRIPASRLIRPEAVNEFRHIGSVPTVDAVVVEGLRRADEKRQLEPALMRIAHEVDETPHGPTEIADITTVHLRVLDAAAFTGIVIKGRALRSVRAKDVADQLVKAAQLPGVRLLVLAAVGDIQQDAKDRLAWLADKVSSDWLILDRLELARLLVAYGELCPRDGTWLAGAGCGVCGYRRASRRRVVRPPFTILTLEDTSVGNAKRFTAHILVPQGLSDDEVENRVRLAIPRLRAERYARNERVATVHGTRQADVIFLFVYEDATDRPFANWICRALWVAPSLKGPGPALFGDPDAQDPALRVDWNTTYEAMAELLSDRPDKGTYLTALDAYILDIEPLIAETRYLLSGNPTKEAEHALSRLAERFDAVRRPDQTKAAPHELTDLDNLLAAIDGDILNIGLPFGPLGPKTWPEAAQRLWLGRRALEQYDTDRRRFDFEREKVR